MVTRLIESQPYKKKRGCCIMASGSKTKTKATYLECEVCQNVVTIRRKRSKMREKNHIKHMYCYKCKEVHAHIETKDDVFLPDWLKDVK